MAASAFVVVAGIVTVGAFIVLGVTHDSRRVVPLVFIIFGAFLASFLVIHWGSKQKDRECAAGYTTSGMGYPNLEQVDPATGLIVRAAGEPLLTRHEQRAPFLHFALVTYHLSLLPPPPRFGRSKLQTAQ